MIRSRSVRPIIGVTVSRNLILVQHSFCRSRRIISIKREVDSIVFAVDYKQVRTFGSPDRDTKERGIPRNKLGTDFRLCYVAFDQHLFPDEKENLGDHF